MSTGVVDEACTTTGDPISVHVDDWTCLIESADVDAQHTDVDTPAVSDDDNIGSTTGNIVSARTGDGRTSIAGSDAYSIWSVSIETLNIISRYVSFRRSSTAAKPCEGLSFNETTWRAWLSCNVLLCPQLELDGGLLVGDSGRTAISSVRKIGRLKIEGRVWGLGLCFDVSMLQRQSCVMDRSDLATVFRRALREAVHQCRSPFQPKSFVMDRTPLATVFRWALREAVHQCRSPFQPKSFVIDRSPLATVVQRPLREAAHQCRAIFLLEPS